MMNEKWFRLTQDEIEKKLKTNAATGLSRKAARSRAQKSTRALFLLPSKPIIKILGDLFADFALILLLFAALISVFFDEWQSGMTVLGLLLGYLLVVGILSYRSQRTMESMSALFCPTVRVIRGGKLFCIDFRSLVVGDVMLLEPGDIVCGDGRLVTSDGLRVRMRLDRETYQSLDKMSDGYVNPKEHRAFEMVNMVHAGSVVEKGSARVIVTAVGQYTYLGAMTGGIEVPFSEELPDAIKPLQKLSTKINIIMLLAVIPLTILSLLISSFGGGTSMLSFAFLTTLALVATTASQLTLVFFRVFYVNRIRKLATRSRLTAIRSIKTASQIPSADFVFAVDGSLFSDGALHFHHAFCAEGNVRTYGKLNPTAHYFSEMVSLYRSAATRTLSTGVSGVADFLDAIQEFIKVSGVDEDALAIRCSCLSYGMGNMLNSSEQVCILDGDRRVWLNVSRSEKLLADCAYAMIGGEKKSLSEEGKQRLFSAWREAITSHQIPIVFTICTDISLSEPCFLGMLFLKEGVDEHWKRNMASLRKQGCRVILFASQHPTAPKIPQEIMEQGFVSKEMFLKNSKPLSYHFGKIGLYTDFEKEDIMELLSEVRAHGYRVLVAGMSEDAISIAAKADGFISCAPMTSYASGYFDEEIQTFEVVGYGSSASSIQSVKAKADVLVARPSSNKGGLASLIQANLHIQGLIRNLSGFFRYLLWSQFLRIIFLTLPMLFGELIMDARHLLLCSCVLDVFAFFSFLENQDFARQFVSSKKFEPKKLKECFLLDHNIMIAVVVASAAALLLPFGLDVVDVFGKYLYRTEFLFTAMIFLHWSILLFLRFGENGISLRIMIRDLSFVLETIFIVLFLFVSLAWEPFGMLFRMGKNPFPYFVLSFVPSLIFLLAALLLRRRESNGKSKSRVE